MNLDQLTARIRTAIECTTNQLRPPVMGPGLPESTRTALQVHLDALLKEELRALTGQAPEGDLAGFAEQNEKFAQDMGLRKDPEPPIYENLWLQATSDLNAAMGLVQQNQEFFGAQCGDDKIKVIGEFFVKWAALMMEPKADTTPWYPDDSGDWVEGHPRELPPNTPMAGWLFRSERDNKAYPTPESDWTAGELRNRNIVAYKVVKP